jgi:DNA polymerase III gamma/tau subunit
MKEALKLALEAVERYQIKRQDFDTFEEVITAIKAALAQQDGQSNFCAQCEAFARELKAVKQALAQPAQKPVSVTYKEVADAMNSLWNGTLEQHQIAQQMANKKLYIAPQQRPWVGLTEAQFLEAVRLAENGNYLVAFVRIQEWLKEGNA